MAAPADAVMAVDRRPGAGIPGARPGLLAYDLIEGPLGSLLLVATAKGVCALRLGDGPSLLAELRGEFPPDRLVHDPPAVGAYTQAVLDHLAGRRRQLDLPLDVPATVFQRRVWDALRQIPYGQTRSYQEVAQSIGAPGATRAVARACASNPVALLIPCHRVVRTGGALSGYRWGVPVKRALLDRERAFA